MVSWGIMLPFLQTGQILRSTPVNQSNNFSQLKPDLGFSIVATCAKGSSSLGLAEIFHRNNVSHILLEK
jgi:hypothetical protein